MAYRDIILADNPVNYWRLGESSGNAVDEMGVHNLTWAGTPVYSATGALVNDANTAMTLDGATEYANFPLIYPAKISLECWVNPSAFTTWQCLFDRGGSAEGFLAFVSGGTSGKPQLSINGGFGSVSAVSTLSTGQWYHLVFIYDPAGTAGQQLQIYINGVLDASGTYSTAIDYSPEPRRQIGRTATSGYFNGSLDEVAVYNYPLTAAQVLLHYNAGMDLLTSVSGTITDDTGAPCQRAIAVLTRPPNVTLLGTTTSDPTTGAYAFTVISGEEVSRVVFDDADGTLYNDLIDRVIPE